MKPGYITYLCCNLGSITLYRRHSIFSQVFSGLMTLRKLCNHPDLVTNDYCELRQLYNGEEGGGRGEGDFTTIDVPRGKGRKKQRCMLLLL